MRVSGGSKSQASITLASSAVIGAFAVSSAVECPAPSPTLSFYWRFRGCACEIIIRVSGVRVPPPLLVPVVASGRTTPPKSATGRDFGGFVCARMGSEASQRLTRFCTVSSPPRCARHCADSDEDPRSDGLHAGAGMGRLDRHAGRLLRKFEGMGSL